MEHQAVVCGLSPAQASFVSSMLSEHPWCEFAGVKAVKMPAEAPSQDNSYFRFCRMRWSVHGIPRVPWDAEGIFDGISTFKLDSNGKIYDHMVNNVILKDPPKEGNPFLAGLNLIPLPQQQQPCPGAWFRSSRKDIKVCQPHMLWH